MIARVRVWCPAIGRSPKESGASRLARVLYRAKVGRTRNLFRGGAGVKHWFAAFNIAAGGRVPGRRRAPVRGAGHDAPFHLATTALYKAPSCGAAGGGPCRPRRCANPRADPSERVIRTVRPSRIDLTLLARILRPPQYFAVLSQARFGARRAAPTSFPGVSRKGFFHDSWRKES